MVEVAVPLKFKSDAKGGGGARWVVGNTAALRGDSASCKVTVTAEARRPRAKKPWFKPRKAAWKRQRC